MIESFHIVGANRETIHGYVQTPDQQAGRFSLVVLAHGFKGFADYGFLPLMAGRIAAAGFVVVRFSFSHSGIQDDTGRFARPDLFERDTFAYQVSDLAAIVRAARDEVLPLAHYMDASRVALVGHSRGGVSSVLATEEIRDVAAVVTLASPSVTLHDEMLKQQLRTLGRVATPSARTGEQLYMGRAIVDDIDQAGEKYDLARVLAGFGGALLAVHCRLDDTVPARSSEQVAAYHSSAGPTDLLLLDDGSHTFGFRHGQEGSTPPLDQATDKVIAFLHEHLG